MEIFANAIQKRTRKMGMPLRRGNRLPDNIIEEMLQEEIPMQSSTVGYRKMTAILRKKGMNARRNQVMHIMRNLDPIGVEMRRHRRIRRRVYQSMGPNHTWHVDGYDKLKPYGFPIHGCIDGFSRKVMWLTVAPTNNDPRVTAYNYMQCVQQQGGCPYILQADPGTENDIMGALQCTFRAEDRDIMAGFRSYSITRSKFNQRIEAWWSIFRRQWADWWILFFQDLVAFGDYDPADINQVYSMRWAFMPLMQQELKDEVDMWNDHHISPSHQGVCPRGQPTVLFATPEELGAEDCLKALDPDDIQWAFMQCSQPGYTGDIDFDQRAARLTQENGWRNAETRHDCLELYYALLEEL